MKINGKENSGITLIALVVTIIVLLILAGISIGAITGDNGIINQAQKAKSDTERSQWVEKIDVAIIDAESKNRNPSINDVIDELKNKDIIDDESQVNKETGAITTNEPEYVIEGKLDDYRVILAENKLVAGNYVNYIDKNGVTRLCCVLWDNRSSYGIQIITMETVEDVEIGNGTGKSSSTQEDFETAKNSINNAVSMLNDKAMNYLNTDYATDARCVGSNPANKNSEASDYFTSDYDYMSEYNGIFKNGDTNYTKDSDKMEDLGIDYYDKDYWLASRGMAGGTETLANFGVCHVYKEDNDERIYTLVGSSICRIHYIHGVSSTSETYGLRPVFTLKTGVGIKGGDGSKENPYNLVI